MTVKAKTFARNLRRAVGAMAVTSALVIAAPAGAEPSGIILPGAGAFPESVTATRDGTLYVGSIGDGGIMRVAPGATKAEVWLAPGSFGSRSTFGVLADEASDTLWVCSNDLSAMGIAGPGEAKGNALKGFDLKTGAGKVSVTLPGPRTFCNDIAIGPDGSAYVANTAAPEVLRLPPGGSAFEVWVTDPRFDPKPGEGALDGLVFGQDGNLYVSLFTKAELYRIAVKDGKAGTVTRLKPSRPLVLSDEMRLLPDGTLLLIEGGGRLDRVTLDGDDAKIDVLRDNLAGGPTGVAVVGNTAWVSIGQLNVLFDAKAGRKPELPFRLVPVPLPQP